MFLLQVQSVWWSQATAVTCIYNKRHHWSSWFQQILFLKILFLSLSLLLLKCLWFLCSKQNHLCCHETIVKISPWNVSVARSLSLSLSLNVCDFFAHGNVNILGVVGWASKGRNGWKTWMFRFWIKFGNWVQWHWHFFLFQKKSATDFSTCAH